MAAAGRTTQRRDALLLSDSLEIVDDYFRPKRLALFHKGQMPGMDLILVLSLLRLKLDVQSNLVTLIDHRAMTRCHLAGVEADNARDGSKVLPCALDHLIRGVGFVRVSPKNHDVRKH